MLNRTVRNAADRIRRVLRSWSLAFAFRRFWFYYGRLFAFYLWKFLKNESFLRKMLLFFDLKRSMISCEKLSVKICNVKHKLNFQKNTKNYCKMIKSMI